MWGQIGNIRCCCDRKNGCKLKHECRQSNQVSLNTGAWSQGSIKKRAKKWSPWREWLEEFAKPWYQWLHKRKVKMENTRICGKRNLFMPFTLKYVQMHYIIKKKVGKWRKGLQDCWRIRRVQQFLNTTAISYI